MDAWFELQFLRPYWLLALLPVAWLLWKIGRIKRKQGAWHQVIAPQFRHLLLGNGLNNELSNKSGNGAEKRTFLAHALPLFGLALIWLLAIIALAGPSTQSVNMPAQKNQQGTVIVLDLSLSMLADDITPNRLARVKYKITDLLTQYPELSIGLVGYAGSAHTISPISEDNQTLLSLLPALNPVLMPQFGSEPLLGFKQAKTLFDGANINHGHVIWITDDLEPEQVSPMKRWIASHPYNVSILTVGTPKGGAVHIPNYGLLKDDNGNIISPPLPQSRFNAFKELSNVTLSHLEVSNQSLNAVLPPSIAPLNTEKAKKSDETQLLLSLDQGVFLLLLLVPLVALLFLRGWILNLSFISLPLVGLLSASLLTVGLFSPSYSYAESQTKNKDISLLDVFKSPDQQAYQAWQESNLNVAESLFENEQWRASTLYKQGKYQEAVQLFRKDDSANGHYNLGNALAKSGQLEEAKQAYEAALKQQPDFQKAQHNLGLIEQLLAQQKASQPSQSNQQNQKDSKEQSDSQEEQGEDAKKDETPSESESKDQNNSNNSEQSSKDSKDSDGESSDESQSSDANNGSDDNSKPESDSDSKSEPESDSKSKSKSGHQESTNESQNEGSQNSLSPSDLKNEEIPQAPPQSAKEAQQKQEDNDEKERAPESGNETVQDSESSEGHQAQEERNTAKLGDQLNANTANSQAEAALTAKQKEQQQATQNWLKQIPDEPGLFLKRKFEYQYQQSNPPGSSDKNKQW